MTFANVNNVGDGSGNGITVSPTNSSSQALLVRELGGFNGSTWDRFRTASLTNYFLSTARTGINSIGASANEKGARWSVFSQPSAGTLAAATIAAEANVRHVVDCIGFSAGSTTAPALTVLGVTVLDGATTIWSYVTIISAVTGQNVVPHSFCGLNLTGTTNTAMTFQFSASLANLIESVSFSGFNVN
jgi:hypothetical protein